MRRAAGLGAAILFGYLSIAIAFGASGRAAGIPAVAVASFSVFVFAGASQFMAVSLLAQGAGVLSIVVALIVPPVVRFPRYLVPALLAGGVNWALQVAGVPVGIALLVAIAAVAAGFAVSPRWSES
ncbi:MAG: AzlC family ABC transporter permease [bacterium]